ncbi:hypothetical protein PAL_GLEAN10022120 [Pteropus alecto]|uniref:Uncharacterized protein n=1 Tax=Pteropus alecto TaxID=9402 RepID=L5K7R0_PTEAL|nr:hypothetical protein PAL_GLEAN10022120 [Pteropus alecto]
MLFLPRSQYYDSVKNVKTTWHSSQSEQDQGLECNAKANTHGEQECLATRKKVEVIAFAFEKPMIQLERQNTAMKQPPGWEQEEDTKDKRKAASSLSKSPCEFSFPWLSGSTGMNSYGLHASPQLAYPMLRSEAPSLDQISSQNQTGRLQTERQLTFVRDALYMPLL